MKRTGVEKDTNMNNNEDEDGNGASSISTSSTSMEIPTGQVLTTDNKIEEENISKKMKRDESSPCEEVEAGPSQSQESIVKETLVDDVLCDESLKNGMEVEVGPSQGGEESSVKEALIDNLPPEMLTKILKCVNTRSLFKCRLVNRQWNEISSGILRNRRDAQNCFIFTGGRFLWCNADYTQYGKKSLKDFMTCMKNSKNCPYSYFAFLNAHDEPLKFFAKKPFTEFISYFTSPNQKIKGLQLNFDCLDDLETLKMVTPKLSDLLLNKIPRLEELVLDFEDSVEAPEVKLFKIPKQTTTSPQFQLPHLKVLRFESPMISSFTGIFKDFLNAAVNLKYLRMQIYSPEDFIFLHSLGKLHLLKETTVELHTDFFSDTESDKNSARLSLPLPKLEIFDLRISMHGISQIYFRQAAIFLGNLFESSKDSLIELKIHPIGFFPGLQLPTFTKLRKLDLTQFNTFPRPIFHPGIRARDVFPAVDFLGLKIDVWDHAFPRENAIPLLPSVKSLVLSEGMHEGIDVSVVALMCPNLIKFKLQKNDRRNPQLKLLPGVRAIWTHMTKLESLEFDVDVEASENNPTALDSCFTGISLENCHRLFAVVEAKETLEMYGFQPNVPNSEIVQMAKREFPSILDMKDLKKLTIHPYWGPFLKKRTNLFTKELTWISEEHAFKFLPHLKPTDEED